MLPKVYFDLEVVTQGEKTDMNPPFMRGRMLALLHPQFKAKPHTYALAIPAQQEAFRKDGGGKLRVFASCREDLDLLVAALSASSWIKDYVRLHYPQALPADYAGPWTAFRRFRVPTLKSDRREGDERGRLRERRMATQAAEKMDYFILYSKTTEQRFTLAVQREEGKPQATDCRPNSYGLCSEQNYFCLPDMP